MQLKLSMKQILQNLSNGETSLVDVPCPKCSKGSLLIASRNTVVSAGTERMLVEFGKANLIDKARQQPDKVRQVLDKVKTDGLAPTLEAVRRKLDQPLTLGYCNVGIVIEVGEEVSGFASGDRVASNGKHAEVVCVPKNLCAKVPDSVDDEAAAFTVIGSIGLQGIRLAQLSLGETVVVTGLGLIGLMTVQLLKAQGCRVLGIDFNPVNLALAKELGVEIVDLSAGADPVAAAITFSKDRGVDAVLITASTKSSEPVHQAALMCRKRGRIVLVGVTGLELSRADFYEKELTFQVSCSYGPGRYDPDYEEKGQDYPVGFVRWTAQRNFEAVLEMMADGRLDVKPLISHRFAIDEAEKAYELVVGPEPSLGILLDYPSAGDRPDQNLLNATIKLAEPTGVTGGAVLGFIGAGHYASSVLIPAFKAAGARLRTVGSLGGVSGVHVGKKYGFEETTTTTDDIFSDEHVNSVVISTRHDSHANLVVQALKAGKNVFVEKPLALKLEELGTIEQAYREVANSDNVPVLMVGFNRRFSPHIKKIKSLLKNVKGPKSFVMTVNAGAVPDDHWTQDPFIGGGRIIGEACHFIDLLRFLAGAAITGHSAGLMSSCTNDTASIYLQFADGSLGTVHYFANGDKSFPKERLEVFSDGKILQLNNFRKLKAYGWPGFNKMNLWRQDKGQKACAAAFVAAVEQGGTVPIAFDEFVEVARVTIGVMESLNK